MCIRDRCKPLAKNKSQYDSTLNLPKTLFEMRAGLPKKEPVMLQDWDDNDLYNQLMKHNEGKPQFRVLSYCDLFLANGLHSPLYLSLIHI